MFCINWKEMKFYKRLQHQWFWWLHPNYLLLSDKDFAPAARRNQNRELTSQPSVCVDGKNTPSRSINLCHHGKMNVFGIKTSQMHADG